ncbi:hypothetical protein RUM43_012402 [Polyplax serrata]|uniref:Uncharacterized protein n=1 Tax=Polyplax serrata TaxID=468196 RepID=A0AAN8RZD4_POLSC
MYGTDLTIVGVIVVIVCQIHVVTFQRFFRHYIMPDKDWGIVVSLYPTIVLTVVTFLLAVLTLIITLAGTGKIKWQCAARLHAKTPLLVLLISAFVLIIVWRYHQSTLYLIYGLLKAIQGACTIYFDNLRHNQTSCITITFTDSDARKLCNATKIEEVCNEFVGKVRGWIFIFGLGDNFVGVGMAIYCVCLAVNYTIIRLESQVEFKFSGRPRY